MNIQVESLKPITDPVSFLCEDVNDRLQGKKCYTERVVTTWRIMASEEGAALFIFLEG
jgi:hypothetical protein